MRLRSAVSQPPASVKHLITSPRFGRRAAPVGQVASRIIRTPRPMGRVRTSPGFTTGNPARCPLAVAAICPSHSTAAPAPGSCSRADAPATGQAACAPVPQQIGQSWRKRLAARWLRSSCAVVDPGRVWRAEPGVGAPPAGPCAEVASSTTAGRAGRTCLRAILVSAGRKPAACISARIVRQQPHAGGKRPIHVKRASFPPATGGAGHAQREAAFRPYRGGSPGVRRGDNRRAVPVQPRSPPPCRHAADADQRQAHATARGAGLSSAGTKQIERTDDHAEPRNSGRLSLGRWISPAARAGTTPPWRPDVQQQRADLAACAGSWLASSIARNGASGASWISSQMLQRFCQPVALACVQCRAASSLPTVTRELVAACRVPAGR